MTVEAMILVNIPFGQISLPADTVERLEQWARWLCPQGYSSGVGGRCASAEGAYDSRYPDEKRTSLATAVDLPAVLAVERVVCTKLPRIAKEIIKRRFARRESDLVIIRALSIHRFRYGNELKRSVLMVRNNLTGYKFHA